LIRKAHLIFLFELIKNAWYLKQSSELTILKFGYFTRIESDSIGITPMFAATAPLGRQDILMVEQLLGNIEYWLALKIYINIYRSDKGFHFS
jgi:hypothetical protein